MKIKSEDLLDLLYNKKLPQIYREEDSKIKYPLKRYLQSLVEGGYEEAIKDIDNLMLLIDPKEIPESLFPYLCRSFGLEYFPDIDVTYQRKFLINLGELIRRRGTFSSIHYLIRALTGLEANLSLSGNNLNIDLLAKDLKQMDSIEVSMEVLSNYIQTQIPYYINPVITSHVAVTVVDSKSYSYSAIGYHKFYKLNNKEDI